MSQSYYIYTIGIASGLGGELYQFDGERSKLGSAEQPIGQFVLTRPLVDRNPITTAQPGTRFIKLVVRQYDRFNNLLKAVEYNDVCVIRLVDGPDLILEFTYKP
jgi:hypothetical protein